MKSVPTSFRLPKTTLRQLDEIQERLASRHRVDALIEAVKLAHAWHFGQKRALSTQSGDVTIRVSGGSDVKVIREKKTRG